MESKKDKDISAEKKDLAVILTKKAAEKIVEFAKSDKKEGYGLKLFVVPGGCSGFQYGLDFAKTPEKTDVVLEQHGVKLFIDKDSLDLLRGSKIDFIETQQGTGFKIDNPNISRSCSCGKDSC